MTIVREAFSRTSPITRLLLHGNLISSGTQLKMLSKIERLPYNSSQYFVCDNVLKTTMPQLQYSHLMNRSLVNHCRLLPNLQPTKLRVQLPTPSIIENAILPSISDFIKIEMPSSGNCIEKQAARLIVIRRRKMKKHKLRKLRIKMKYEWAKVRQRREMRKEKAFQAKLISQIKEAEKFDAAKYIAERLEKAHEFQLPRTWKGKILPEFIIKEKLGIK